MNSIVSQLQRSHTYKVARGLKRVRINLLLPLRPLQWTRCVSIVFTLLLSLCVSLLPSHTHTHIQTHSLTHTHKLFALAIVTVPTLFFFLCHSRYMIANREGLVRPEMSFMPLGESTVLLCSFALTVSSMSCEDTQVPILCVEYVRALLARSSSFYCCL